MTCPAFIAQSMAVRTAAHLLHLSTTSYAQHKALNHFYDDLVPLIDAYAETYQGENGLIKEYPVVAPPVDHALTLLSDYLDLVQEEQQEDEERSEALQNILAEIEQLAATTIYKLRFLK